MKKGQATDFLMTYGWAILVVIGVIAALAYFGVLDPSKLLPEEVTTMNETNETSVTFEKHCIEWDGWIQRDNMVWNCYDFVGDVSIKCGYNFLENSQLEVIRLKEPIKLKYIENLTGEEEDYVQDIELYNCSRWIKTWGEI